MSTPAQRKGIRSSHLKASVTAFRDLWSDEAVLGEAAAYVYKCGVPFVLHPAVALMGLFNLCFLAANGLKVRVRAFGSCVTNFGSIFYHCKKTGKSNYTDFVYKHAEVFECQVNHKVCAEIFEMRKQKEDKVPGIVAVDVAGEDEPAVIEPRPTNIVYKNVGPEEMLAQCDPEKPGCIWFSRLRAEAEFGSHCEQVNMLGSGGANKKYENQAGYNDLFDDGKVSKMYRSAALNYGKDIFANWKHGSA